MARRCSWRAWALVVILCAFWACAGAVSATAESAYDATQPNNLTNAHLIGSAALVMDMDSGTVLYNRNIDKQTYPASTTKIMTCLVALEHTSPDDIVTIPAEANDIPWDSSKLEIKTGEKIRMIDLLYGMMMKSGNDASIAIALHVAGSIEAFSDMMNERAAELGCTSTNFVNPHGYHDPAHVTTAREMAIIAAEAMRNPTFREIVAAKSYTMAATNMRERRRLETSYNMYVASSQFYYPELIGVKTGYHSKAGYCFVGAAERDGMHLISVVMRTDQNGRWSDTRKLMDYGFSCFRTYTFDEMYQKTPVYASIAGAARDDPDAGVIPLVVVPGEPISSYTMRCLPERFDAGMTDFASRLSVHYTHALEAPIYQGDIMGTVAMETDAGTLTGTLIASRDVAKDATPFSMSSLLPDLANTLSANTWLIILGAVALIVILIVILRIRAAIRANKRRREMLRRRRSAYDKYHRSGMR